MHSGAHRTHSLHGDSERVILKREVSHLLGLRPVKTSVLEEFQQPPSPLGWLVGVLAWQGSWSVDLKEVCGGAIQQQHRVRGSAWLAQQPQRTLWASRDGGQHGDLTCECAVHQARGCGACWHIMSPCSRRRHSWVCTLAVRVLQVRSRARRPITREFARCFSARRPAKVIIHADTICGRGRGRMVHGHTFAGWMSCWRVVRD